MKRAFEGDQQDRAWNGTVRRRKLVPRFTFDEVSPLFRQPLKTAANAFGICTTVFKKECRMLGIQRWPHRKVRGVLRDLDKASTVEERRKLEDTLQLLHTFGYYQGRISPTNSEPDTETVLWKPAAKIPHCSRYQPNFNTGHCDRQNFVAPFPHQNGDMQRSIAALEPSSQLQGVNHSHNFETAILNPAVCHSILLPSLPSNPSLAAPLASIRNTNILCPSRTLAQNVAPLFELLKMKREHQMILQEKFAAVSAQSQIAAPTASLLALGSTSTTPKANPQVSPAPNSPVSVFSAPAHSASLASLLSLASACVAVQ